MDREAMPTRPQLPRESFVRGCVKGESEGPQRGEPGARASAGIQRRRIAIPSEAISWVDAVVVSVTDASFARETVIEADGTEKPHRTQKAFMNLLVDPKILTSDAVPRMELAKLNGQTSLSRHHAR